MISSEQDFFIQVLCDFINKKRTNNVPKDLNVDTLYVYGKKHEVQAIFYYQTKLQEFLKSYSSTIYLNTNRTAMIERLISSFNFPYYIVKGTAVSNLYPIPIFRTMGDIDLVVQPENREKANEIFINQGYECRSKRFDREWQYYKNGMEFELHDRLIYTETVSTKKMEVFFNNFGQYGHANTLDWNFHFLFLISHLRKHFMNEGVGFRQFMDIAIVAKYGNLNWKWIEEKAEKLELLPFLKTVLAFCNRWFEIQTPILTPSLDEEFYEQATQKIFEDGVFGFSNERNFGCTAVNLYRKSGKIGQIAQALKVVFPSYEDMSSVSQYSWIKGRCYLLPIAWIYRIFYGWKWHKSMINEMRKSFTDSDTISKREAIYKQWGL